MTKQIIGSIVLGLMTLYPTCPAQAYQNGSPGGNQGGGWGFTGSPGSGFTGPRGSGFTETLGPGSYSATNLRGFNPRSADAGSLGTQQSLGEMFVNLRRSQAAKANRSALGWNNPYMVFHRRWFHGFWTGSYPGGLGWRPLGYGTPGFDGASLAGGLGYGLGIGMEMDGLGLSSWIYGPMLYNYGYATYSNPYVEAGSSPRTHVPQQPAAYDYSQPINAQRTPPVRATIDLGASNFDAARHAFRSGDFARALELVDQALESTPDDPALHEFRALTLFALTRYDETARALYAVLSIQPGWDWTTLIRLYDDVESYTRQLRALEVFTTQSPGRAPAHFVLAYHYLTQGHADAALGQFKLVTSRQPSDVVSAQVICRLEHPQQRHGATGLANANTARSTAASREFQTSDMPDAAKQGKIEGNWTAQPGPKLNIEVAFQAGGRYSWKVSRQGKDQHFQGKSSNKYGTVTLVEDQTNNKIVGYLRWIDETHFVFTVMGAGSADPGLSFAKTP
jgi:tetratricopeptide (TPR) repeat protein